MTEQMKRDFSLIDRPEILQYLFHPRPEWGENPAGAGAVFKQIPVTEDVAIGACFHLKDKASPNILFFTETVKSCPIIMISGRYTTNWESIFWPLITGVWDVNRPAHGCGHDGRLPCDLSLR